MTQSLNQFFRDKKQRSDSEDTGINWGQRREEWLHALEVLYRAIEGFVSEPQKQGVVSVVRRPKAITENHLGTYTAEELVLTVGGEEVVFSPRGRNIAGAQGRVDVRGESGESMLVVNPGPRWSVVVSRYPQLRLVNLDAETLTEMLGAVMRQ
jgi:hypothetical protein